MSRGLPLPIAEAIKILDRRREWLIARQCIREDDGLPAGYDREESDALQVAVNFLRGKREEQLLVELKETRQKLESANAECTKKMANQKATIKVMQSRINQLRSALIEGGITIPRADDI